jgi:hypothetical protein
MSLSFFEEIRRRNADFYTAHPLTRLDDEAIVKLAADCGLTVEELRHQMVTPGVANTCALCGRPQTHLIGCKGCGGGAWGGEFEEAYGQEAAQQIRVRLREALSQVEGVSPEQAQVAAKNACAWGGCMVCEMCWHNTLPTSAYESCPIRLFAYRTVEPGWLPFPLVWATLLSQKQGEAGSRRRVAEWLEGIWAYWTEVWNTVPTGPEREAVAKWRAAILEAASRAEDGNLD